MVTPAVRVLPGARVEKPEPEAREDRMAPPGQAVLREVSVRGQGVARVPPARMQIQQVWAARVPRDVPIRDRPEAQPQANQLIRTDNLVCGQKVAHVGRAARLARARVRGLRPDVRARLDEVVGQASPVLDAHNRVPVTAMQTVRANHVQHLGAMTGSQKVRQRTSRAWASQNPREGIARRMLRDRLAATERLLGGYEVSDEQALSPRSCVNRWYSKTFWLNTC